MIRPEDCRISPTRRRALLLSALAAIPFWAAVSYLDPLDALRPAPRVVPAPMVQQVPSRPSFSKCWHLQEQRHQSLRDCPFRTGTGPTRSPGFGPGDFPLRGQGDDGLVAGRPGSGSGS